MKCIFNGFGQNSKENSKMKKKGSSPQSWELNKPPSNLSLKKGLSNFFFQNSDSEHSVVHALQLTCNFQVFWLKGCQPYLPKNILQKWQKKKNVKM